MLERTGEIKEFIKQRVLKKASLFNVDLVDIDDEFSLTGSGVFDSMDFLELINDVEDRFNVSIELDEASAEEFTTIAGIIKYVNRRP